MAPGRWHDAEVNTILIVDDDDAFRSTARALLEADGFEVVGEAHNADRAMSRARTLRPAVVLLDIGLPDTDGFAAARILLGEHPELSIVLTSSREAASFGPRLTESGLPFLPKDEISGTAVRALLVAA